MQLDKSLAVMTLWELFEFLHCRHLRVVSDRWLPGSDVVEVVLEETEIEETEGDAGL